MADTKKFIAACTCTAAYTGTINVPADYTLAQAAEYAHEHLKEIPIDSGLEYIGGTDELVVKNCRFEEIPESDIK